MKIAVCMKQVPAYSEGNMDEQTGLLIRSGLKSVVNVYDLSALETALRIKEQTEAVIDVYTMGPEKAEQVLREAYALGADRGFLISGRNFGGADVLATSYTLMQALSSQEKYDLILCGKQTTDGDTAQVSGALAKWLEIPHFTNVVKLVSVNQKEIEIEQISEEDCFWRQISYPCLLAVNREIFSPRMPSLKLKIAGRKKEIVRIGLDSFSDQTAEHYGLSGSATRVRKIFPPQRTQRRQVFKMEGEEAASYILETADKILSAGEGVL